MYFFPRKVKPKVFKIKKQRRAVILIEFIISNLSIVESKYSQARIAAPDVWPYEGSNLARLAEIFRSSSDAIHYTTLSIQKISQKIIDIRGVCMFWITRICTK